MLSTGCRRIKFDCSSVNSSKDGSEDRTLLAKTLSPRRTLNRLRSQNESDRIYCQLLLARRYSMANQRELVYLLIRYSPRIAGDEINIGFVLFEPNDLEKGFCKARFLDGWQDRVTVFDPNADLDMLQALANDISARLDTSSTRMEMLNVMEDSFSSTLRISERFQCVTDDPDNMLCALAHRLGPGKRLPGTN